ncbi:integrin alpha-V [Protopterus annectens]|uniref:integrin alpha-V n=1 Tax=Protopterus annectens TaxID=7888 RepID=UPI001CFAB488|nr:integrin alpha-V [Protopterus annectens]
MHIMDLRSGIALIQKLLLFVLALLDGCVGFNLDVDIPTVYTGPSGSYFGFSVDFFAPPTASVDLLIGAPKANTSQPDIVEGGAVYKCKWGSNSECYLINFDSEGNRLRNPDDPPEFKSYQWFGASVRSQNANILACAPMYHWATTKKTEREPVGTCFLQAGSKIVEYAPCRSGKGDAEGQGFCQGGFSIDFTKSERVLLGGPGSFYWQGQLISDKLDEILSQYRADRYTIKYANQLATKSASAAFDDSYLGYSVAVGDFNKDNVDDFVSGIPRAEKTKGLVTIYSGTNMESILSFTGEQMAAYFGHSVAATDINHDGLTDLIVGAPLFMDRGSDGKLREVGQVYVYLQDAASGFQNPKKITGSEIYARFGTAIAPLGDVDQDGFNDVAIAAPYGGDGRKGIVYIFNGKATGLNQVQSQMLEGQWAAQRMPPSFGYSMHGATDLDKNGYPDLIVGAFGADKAVLYRARPVINVESELDVTPSVLNPEEKTCDLPDTGRKVSCFKVKFCLSAKAVGKLSSTFNFQVDLQLDRLKQKGAIKRALFIHSQLPVHAKNMTVTNWGSMVCEELVAYLKDESEFRDKLTPINIFMEYRLDLKTAADSTGLQPILNQFTPANVSKQAHILLDCGEDNICKPDLKISVKSELEKIYIGDDSPLTLTVNTQNQGEGAYEAELLAYIPPQADFIGVVRNDERLSRLSCAFKSENNTRMVVCDLGNPMKAGTNLQVGLRFSVHQLSEMDTSVNFNLKIHSTNAFNSESPVVSWQVGLAVLAAVEIRGVSTPDQLFLPIPNWQPKEDPKTEEDVGPLVQQIYELRNNGPSAFSKAMLELLWPYKYKNNTLLYIIKFDTEGPMNCTTDVEINPLNLKITSTQGEEKNETYAVDDSRNRNRKRRDVAKNEGEFENLNCGVAECLKITCPVGHLERGRSAILYIRARLWTQTFINKENQNHSYSLKTSASYSVIEMPYKNLSYDLPSNSTVVNTYVMWVQPEIKQPVPYWVIILAVLAGLLLLGLLVFVMYKVGFFKRVRPPQEEQEREQLQPQENGDGAVEA